MAKKVTRKKATIKDNNDVVEPSEYLKKYIADHIRKARRARDFTVQYLADNTDLTREALNQIERAKNHVNAATLYKIATRLDFPIETFFPPFNDDYALGPKGKALIVEADPNSLPWIEDMFNKKKKK